MTRYKKLISIPEGCEAFLTLCMSLLQKKTVSIEDQRPLLFEMTRRLFSNTLYSNPRFDAARTLLNTIVCTYHSQKKKDRLDIQKAPFLMAPMFHVHSLDGVVYFAPPHVQSSSHRPYLPLHSSKRLVSLTAVPEVSDCPSARLSLSSTLSTAPFAHARLFHEANYVDMLVNIQHWMDHRPNGEYCVFLDETGDTLFTPYVGALIQANQVVLSHLVQAVQQGTSRHFALCTPLSGHHAEKDRAAGFCVINHAMLLKAAFELQGKTVTVVDLDIHGSVDLSSTSHVLDVTTVRQYPYFYELDNPDALSETVYFNAHSKRLVLQENLDPQDYVCLVKEALRQMPPTDIVIVSMGYDTRKGDPTAVDRGECPKLGQNLLPEHFYDLGHHIDSLRCRTVICQEGGYEDMRGGMKAVQQCRRGFFLGLSGRPFWQKGGVHKRSHSGEGSSPLKVPKLCDSALEIDLSIYDTLQTQFEKDVAANSSSTHPKCSIPKAMRPLKFEDLSFSQQVIGCYKVYFNEEIQQRVGYYAAVVTEKKPNSLTLYFPATNEHTELLASDVTFVFKWETAARYVATHLNQGVLYKQDDLKT